MILLIAGSIVYLDGSDNRSNLNLYITPSAQKHAASDTTTLAQAFKKALCAPVDGFNKKEQEPGVFRVKINSGNGYIVYKMKSPDNDSACMFHYHWNYKMDLPLNVY